MHKGGPGQERKGVEMSCETAAASFKKKRAKQLEEKTAFSLSTCFHADFVQFPLEKSCVVFSPCTFRHCFSL